MSRFLARPYCWGRSHPVAPDLPLFGLSIGGMLYFTRVDGLDSGEAARHIFSRLYFYDPIWISLHNILHSPTSLIIGLCIVHFFGRRSPPVGNWLQWFLLACVLHSAVDIVTHHDDGPLLLWPFEWTWRYSSPVSYWDHRHYGSVVWPLELLLDAGLGLWLLTPGLSALRNPG